MGCDQSVPVSSIKKKREKKAYNNGTSNFATVIDPAVGGIWDGANRGDGGGDDRSWSECCDCWGSS